MMPNGRMDVLWIAAGRTARVAGEIWFEWSGFGGVVEVDSRASSIVAGTGGATAVARMEAEAVLCHEDKVKAVRRDAAALRTDIGPGRVRQYEAGGSRF